MFYFIKSNKKTPCLPSKVKLENSFAFSSSRVQLRATVFKKLKKKLYGDIYIESRAQSKILQISKQSRMPFFTLVMNI